MREHEKGVWQKKKKTWKFCTGIFYSLAYKMIHTFSSLKGAEINHILESFLSCENWSNMFWVYILFNSFLFLSSNWFGLGNELAHKASYFPHVLFHESWILNTELCLGINWTQTRKGMIGQLWGNLMLKPCCIYNTYLTSSFFLQFSLSFLLWILKSLGHFRIGCCRAEGTGLTVLGHEFWEQSWPHHWLHWPIKSVVNLLTVCLIKSGRRNEVMST